MPQVGPAIIWWAPCVSIRKQRGSAEPAGATPLTKATSKTEREFKAALGDFIIAWNALEWNARYLLEILAGLESYAGQIVTARIEGPQLAKALASIAEIHAPRCRNHVRHFSKGFDRIRETRNYLVHSVKGIALHDGLAVGIANDIKVGEALKFRQSLVTLSDIEQAGEAVAEFHAYGSAILTHLLRRPDLTFDSYIPLEQLEMPDIPTNLAAYSPLQPVPFTRLDDDTPD